MAWASSIIVAIWVAISVTGSMRVLRLVLLLRRVVMVILLKWFGCGLVVVSGLGASCGEGRAAPSVVLYDLHRSTVLL